MHYNQRFNLSIKEIYFQFEIDAEDNPDVTIQGNPLSECHNELIKAINKTW